jgi:lactate dehydrogenase-like 2-hydroxyacid dehydrogenase
MSAWLGRTFRSFAAWTIFASAGGNDVKMLFTEMLGNQDQLRSAFPDDDLRLFDGPLDEDELVHEAEGCSVISVFIRTKVSEKVIDHLPELRMINTRSAGFDHIAARHAMEKGIAVTHIPSYGPHVVAEHAFCLLLACARNLIPANRSVKERKRFDFEPFIGVELKNKVLGVIGTGKIGAEVIRIAHGFGMEVVAFDMYRNEKLAREYDFPYLDLDEVLERSDFVTLHLPLTPDTENLIDRAALRKMKEGSILINTARGKIVDEAALRESLDAGHLAAAGLDVIDDESHPENDPLLTSDKTVVTPHIGFYTRESIGRILADSIQTIEAFRSGVLDNQIPRDYLGKKVMHTHPQD